MINNSIQILGRAGADPKVKKLESGKIVANLSIATDESYRNSEGEKVSNTLWHDVVAWGKSAELVEQLIKKGSQVVIQGKLTYRQYDHPDKGQLKITEILLNEFFLIDSK